MSDFTIYNNIPRIMPTPSAPKPLATPAPEATDSFVGTLKDAIAHVNNLETGTQGELQKFMNNESDLHSVMISLEKADLSFQMMMQVRNKIVSAYQEIMKTQV